MSWDNMVGSKELLIVRCRGEEKPSTGISFVVHRKLWAKVDGIHYSFLLSVCVCLYVQCMHMLERERERERDLIQGLRVKNHWVVNMEGQSSNWGGCVSEAYKHRKVCSSHWSSVSCDYYGTGKGSTHTHVTDKLKI